MAARGRRAPQRLCRPGDFRSAHLHRLLLGDRNNPNIVKVVRGERRPRAVLLARRNSISQRSGRAVAESSRYSTSECTRIRAMHSSNGSALPPHPLEIYRKAGAAQAARGGNSDGSSIADEPPASRNRYRGRLAPRQCAVGRIHRGTVENAAQSKSADALHLRHRRRRVVAREGNRRRVDRPAARRARACASRS